MAFKNLNIDQIKSDAEQFILKANDSYIETYPEFISYFDNINQIDKHNLVVASHFVYGWMPTIIDLNTDDLNEVLPLLNAVKKGYILNAKELTVLKKCINNSLVGLSKLLHFINPGEYAIWDSRIHRYLTEKKSQYGIGNPETYLEYLKELKKLASNGEYEKIHKSIERHFSYKITPLRAIEIVIFEADRNKQKELKAIKTN